MGKTLLAVIIAVLLFLDWAALDDITTGNEVDYRLEWATVMLSLLVFASAIFYFARRQHKLIRRRAGLSRQESGSSIYALLLGKPFPWYTKKVMTVSRPLLKSLILFVIIILAGILLIRYQKTATSTLTPSSLKPTPTSASIQESEVHSPDGAMKLVMRTQKNNDQSNNYSFFMADITGKEERSLFTKTIESKDAMSLPKNSFSPDNKYVYLEESEFDLLNALVFKVTGEPFANGKSYLDVATLLAQSKPGYRLTHVSGWASPQFLQINTVTEKFTKGPSYWFDVVSGSFLLH